MVPVFGVSGEAGYIGEPGWEEAEEIVIGEGRPRVLVKAVETVEDR